MVLGEVMRDKERLGRLVSDTVVALRPEVFGGAEAIKIHLGRGDTVRMMEFEYAPDTDFRATLREYTESLGKPLDMIESSQGTRAFWMDGVTRFELGWEVRGGSKRYYALMIDLSSR